MTNLHRLVAFLDAQFTARPLADTSHNGLQVENNGRISRICAGVDASLEFFQAAQRRGADLLVCHHGISWGDSLKQLTTLNYRRVEFLMKHNMALYASHLPLDAHPQWGNNILLARALGLRHLRRFGVYHGVEIGYAGRLPRAVALRNFSARLGRVLNCEPTVLNYGAPHIQVVGVVSGGAAFALEEAHARGLDVLVTGEVSLQGYVLARDLGFNAIFGGHYATEKLGVQAVAEALSRRFRLPAEFIDLKVRQ